MVCQDQRFEIAGIVADNHTAFANHESSWSHTGLGAGQVRCAKPVVLHSIGPLRRLFAVSERPELSSLESIT